MPKRDCQYAVWLHERKVGILSTTVGHTSFVLDPDYARDPNRSVLGLRFEEVPFIRHRSNVRLPPWFSNLLPEGRLREWIAQARHVPESQEVDLLAEVGHDLPGAVRVTEDDARIHPDAGSRGEAIVDEPETRTNDDTWRFSLAGVAMKFSMLQAGDRFTAPGVGNGGDWIVKLPDALYPHVPLNEFAMMELARASGLDVPETQLVHRDLIQDLPETLWPTGEQEAYAVRRFDRSPGRQRIHIEDFAQVRGFYPENKYKGSFETLAALIYRQRDTRSLIEFVRRLVFSILIGNGDAHLKNWSLLYEDPRIPRLSPAYDLVATSIYRPSSTQETLALKFGESRRFEDVSLATFARLQRKLNATDVSLVDEVRAFAQRVLTAWPQASELLKNEPALLAGIGIGLKKRVASLLRG